MRKAAAITCVFLDIGGVLLTNGWDHQARKRAAKIGNDDPPVLLFHLIAAREVFKLEWSEEDWHHLTFDTYEEGNLTLQENLGRVVFYQKRPLTPAQFQRFMFAQSKPYPEMIKLFAQL